MYLFTQAFVSSGLETTVLKVCCFVEVKNLVCSDGTVCLIKQSDLEFRHAP